MSRPPLPQPGERIDLAQAARLVTAYLPGVRTELRAAVATIRRRHPSAPLHVREWTPPEIVTCWGSGVTMAVLVGYVMVDDMGHPARWRSVLVLVDKGSGELIVQDDSGLLEN